MVANCSLCRVNRIPPTIQKIICVINRICPSITELKTMWVYDIKKLNNAIATNNVIAMHVTSITIITKLIVNTMINKKTSFKRMLLFIENGASGQNRTADTRIFSPLLYRLSYRGKYGGADEIRTRDLLRDRQAC